MLTKDYVEITDKGIEAIENTKGNKPVKQLEFELTPVYIGKFIINYDVLRKGLKVGELSLEEPYNMKEAQCTTLKLTP